MIRFCGKISSQYEKDIIALRGRQVAIMYSFITIILTIIGVIVAIIFHLKADLYWFVVYGLILLVIALVLFVTARPKRNFIVWDYDITINEDIIKIIWQHQNGFVTTKTVKKIKKVVDYGEYYLLFLFRWDASHSIICQKDLLVDGSLEEFENIFSGKIKVMKNQKT